MQRPSPAAVSFALLALLSSALPAAAATGSLPGGTSLSIDITTPADGAIVNLGAPLAVTGTASIGQGASTPSTGLVYVVDVSQSTTNPVFDGVATCDDSASSGGTGTVLDCEVRSLVNLNQEAIAKGTVVDVAAVAFASAASAGDVGPATGTQVRTGPATDANSAGGLDIEQVLGSAWSSGSGSPPWGFRLFTPVSSSGGQTDYQAAVQVAGDLATGSTGTNRIVVMVSDGVATDGVEMTEAQFSAFVAANSGGARFYTFAVGDAASCASNPNSRGSLEAIANATGGTCTTVADPASLPDIVPAVVGASLNGISLTVDGVTASDPGVTPTLPQEGPASVDWSTSLSALGVGSHQICATATGSDAGGSDSVSDCVDIVVRAVSAGGPYGGPGGGGGSADLEGSSVAIAATLFGDAAFDHWEAAPDSGTDLGASCSFADATAASTTVSCTDDGGYTLTAFTSSPTDSQQASLTLGNAAPVISSAIFAPDGTVLSGTPVGVTVTFADSGTNDAHTCSIDWSDGASQAGTVVESSGAGTCGASRTLTAGSYTASATITDDDGDSDAEDVTSGAGGGGLTLVVVDDAVSAGGPYGGDASAIEGTAVPISATVVDGATFGYWSATPAGTDPGASCSFGDASMATTTVTCTDDGVFGLTAYSTGPSDSQSTTLTIGNASPSLSPIALSPASIVPAGTTVGASASFTDPGLNDSHTCTVRWDDGLAAVSGTVTETAGSGSGTCSGSAVFATPGVHRITLTVLDDDGATASVAYEYLVVYDPAGGFVTGGGWIDVGAGSYPADATLAGRATFGFVSKYQKGAATPQGGTEFQFHAAGLNFNSGSYEWLVVSGARAQFKGAGSINGVSGFSFLVTATDGQISGGGGTDRFRIKIWNASGTIVFDNVLGASTDVDLANPQAIGGGSIVIQARR